MATFHENLQVSTEKHVETRDGLSYLSWAIALSLAGRPKHTPVIFGNNTYLPVFGGAVVAIDMDGQRTWLPVLDNRNKPVAKPSSRDVNDTLQRCRAKAVAMVTGIGLSLYAGYAGNAEKFDRELGITPETDLATAKPISSEKGGSSKAAYLDWASALAAAKVTDPGFLWEVQFFPGVDRDTGEIINVPYLQSGDTFMVGVNVTYKGVAHTEWLPIMGVMQVQTTRGPKKMDHQPLTNPDVFDWNRSIMRCLAKAIAVATGYGLGIYSGEDADDDEKGDDAGSSNASADDWLGAGSAKVSEPAATPAAQPEAAKADPEKTKPDLTRVRQLLKDAQKDELGLCQWLGLNSLEDADQEAVDKAIAVLETALKKLKEKAA